MKKRIAISMGDAAGIGPELLIKLFLRNDIDANMVVVGDMKVLEAANDVLGNKLKLRCVSTDNGLTTDKSTMNVIDIKMLQKKYFALGHVDKLSGKASVEYLLKTAQMAQDGLVDAIASAPLNKEAMQLGGYNFQGQTELLADFAKTKEFAMVLFFGPIKLFYLTNHVSLKTALESIRYEIIMKKITFIDKILKNMKEENRKIAVMALNPHAGENGKMGIEEINEIAPAIKKAKEGGIQAIGPIPADSVFIKAKAGEYGAVLAMYHDQGNIAAKLLNFGSGVTYIAGLPFIRTSVAHGTAYDIAGRGIADESTLVEAVKLAIRLAKER